ncbi:MAG: DUF2306 domain-containing protein [Litoreibacter sp.]|nr:DUF2306 domain-containing protein [Litoreibacter sp.]
MTPAIWVHAIAAVAALFLGAYVLWRPKGDAAHKWTGRVWAGLMAVTALSSFGIREIFDGWFSPIHILSVYTLVTLVVAIHAIRNRDRIEHAVLKHQTEMKTLFASGMLIAGGFTFMPERLLGRLTFGETYPMINYVFVALTASIGAYVFWRGGRAARALRKRAKG